MWVCVICVWYMDTCVHTQRLEEDFGSPAQSVCTHYLDVEVVTGPGVQVAGHKPSVVCAALTG